MAPQEMAFAVWLVAKGLDRPTAQLDQSPAYRVEVMS